MFTAGVTGGSTLGAVFVQKAKILHPKIYAKKVRNIDAESLKMMLKWSPKSMSFHTFSKKAKTLQTICFTIENVALGT